MVSSKLSKLAVFAGALALGAVGIACSDGSGGGTGTGGKSGTGGATGSGGKVGTGGATVGTGGTTAGTGGSTGTGGSGDGAVTTDGGDGATDGATAHLLNYTFDTTVQGFKINDFAMTGNIGAPDGGTGVALTFDNGVGDPSPGSLQMTGTFTNYNQTLDAILNLPAMLDLTGKTLHARIKLDSGTVAFAVLHASTTSSFKYKNGDFKTPTSSFSDLPLVVPAADLGDGGTGWNPAQFVQVGVQIGTGNPPADAGLQNGDPLPSGPETVTVHIDTITD
jgi:hypothetical protein